MAYALVNGGQFVRWVNLRTDFPTTSFPNVIAAADLPEGVVFVHDTGPEGQPGPLQVVDQVKDPVLVNGEWHRQYIIRDMTDAEKAQKFEQVKMEIVAATQARLDAFAQTRSYDGILSAATYATSTVPKFQAEGQYAVNIRDLTWAKLYDIMAEVDAGQRQPPLSFDDIQAELPVMEWPV